MIRLENRINGIVAQLGERTVRIREVEGSNPFSSTTNKGHPSGCPLFMVYMKKGFDRAGVNDSPVGCQSREAAHMGRTGDKGDWTGTIGGLTTDDPIAKYITGNEKKPPWPARSAALLPDCLIAHQMLLLILYGSKTRMSTQILSNSERQMRASNARPYVCLYRPCVRAVIVPADRE